MADLVGGELADLIDPEVLAGVIFNENRSLRGQQLDDANMAVAHVLLNRLKRGRPIGQGHGTAPIELPEQMSDDERDVVLEQARRAARQALEARRRGVDPTSDALGYGHRAVEPRWSPEFTKDYLEMDRKGADVRHSYGPFSNSAPTDDLPKGHPVYLNVYDY